MATIVTINASDQISSSRADINTSLVNLNADKIETSYIDTDTAMAANSDTKIPSQKAVKTYIDTQGGANASETVRGIVEIATSAEVDAGTGTGGTGAKIVLTPENVNAAHNIPFVVPGTSGNIMTSDGTDWVSSTASPAFFQQTFPLNGAMTSARGASGSNSTGSLLFQVHEGTSISRYERTLGGTYFRTHSVAAGISIPTSDYGGIIVIGSYVYLFSNDGTNIVAQRYDIADLANSTSMTVPTVACTSVVNAWTDGVDAYVCSSSSQTTSRRWTVSGTTFTAASTATVTTAIFAEVNCATMWDGTTAYLIKNLGIGNGFTIRKLATIDGSSYSTTTILYDAFSDVQNHAYIIPIDSTKIYIGFNSPRYDEAASIASVAVLLPYTKP